MILIPIFVIAGVAAGPLLAKVKTPSLRRIFLWLLLIALVFGAAIALTKCDALVRMIGICCVLLGGMKGMVYAEWANDRKLPLSRYLIFSFLWFGMDPGSFQHRREGLSWKEDARVGLLLMLAGTLGAWLVWVMEWRQILVMFIPMSLGFHFGALRLLKAGLRYSGFPVRTLFPNLLNAEGIGDFWSRRWNIGYSQMMQRLVGRPIEAHLGANAGTMSVFLMSGLMHELAITLPARAGFGLPSLYFAVHGILTVWEKKSGRSCGKFPALLAVAVPLGMLFPPTFQTEVIEKFLGVFHLMREILP